MTSRVSQRGFTIVELLIVIVIIGILASITVVAYNGVRDRAHASQTLSSVDAWEKLIKTYKATSSDGKYPAVSVETCLGENFPADSDFPVNQCVTSPSGTDSVDPSLMAKLKTVTSSLPAGPTPIIVSGTTKVRGIVYMPVGNGVDYIIAYYLRGDQACGRGSKAYMSAQNLTACMVTLL
ncbi:Type II secretion system protein G precursor [compost metagenome]